HLRDDCEGLQETRRAAEERTLDVGRAKALALCRDLQRAAVDANRARPRLRPVDENAVRKGHSSESDLLLGHLEERSRRGASAAEHVLRGEAEPVDAELQIVDGN